MGKPSDPAVRELGEGPPLVLINGYAASNLDWDPGFLDGLAAASTVICPDNRGIGDNGAAPRDLSVTSMAEDVIAALDERDIEQADVAGWSMGGFIAQQLAADAPHRVRRLALISTDPGGPASISAEGDVWTRLIDHGGTPREQASRLISLIFPAGFAETVDAEFGDVIAAARAKLLPDTLTAQEGAMAAWHTEPSDARLAAIAAPAYVAAGDLDEVIPPANARVLAERIPGSEAEIYEGCGHAFMAQEPARLSAAINDWLGR